jgi:hypothetical protein
MPERKKRSREKFKTQSVHSHAPGRKYAAGKTRKKSIPIGINAEFGVFGGCL